MQYLALLSMRVQKAICGNKYPKSGQYHRGGEWPFSPVFIVSMNQVPGLLQKQNKRLYDHQIT